MPCRNKSDHHANVNLEDPSPSELEIPDWYWYPCSVMICQNSFNHANCKSAQLRKISWRKRVKRNTNILTNDLLFYSPVGWQWKTLYDENTCKHFNCMLSLYCHVVIYELDLPRSFQTTYKSLFSVFQT